MKKVNYKEIALIAGVSQASVTRFFKKNSKVSKDVEDKIAIAIKTLQLSVPVEKVVGIIIPDTKNPFFTEIAFEFEKELEKLGWHLLISNSEGRLSKDLLLIEKFKGLGITGLIYINSGNQSEELYSRLIANHNDLPVLSFDRVLDSTHFDYVAIDNEKGTKLAVEYLLCMGHKKIGYLKGLKGTAPAKERFDSFAKTISASELALDKELIYEGDFQFTSGLEYGKYLSSIPQKSRPTAVICGNDLMALGLMQQLQLVGWKLPEQLSVIGFDDVPMCNWVYPTLTTISQPIRIMVIKAIQMLLQRISAQENNKRIEQQKLIIDPRLIIRNSVCKL